jgi:hypothetical protein
MDLTNEMLNVGKTDTEKEFLDKLTTQERLDKLAAQERLQLDAAGKIYSNPYDERNRVDVFKKTLEFIDGLKVRGVLSFSGHGLALQLSWDSGTVNKAPESPPEPVDVGGGLLMDPRLAADLLGHEK